MTLMFPDMNNDNKERRIIAIEEFLLLSRENIVKELRNIIEEANYDDVFVEILENWDTFDNRDLDIREGLVNAIKDEEKLIELTYNHLNIEDDIFVSSISHGLIKDNDILLDMVKKTESGYRLGSSDVDIVGEFNITDDDALIDIAKNAMDSEVRISAIEKIKDVEILMDILKNDKSSSVKSKIIEILADENISVNIAYDCIEHIGILHKAIKNITNKHFLEVVIKDYVDGISRAVDRRLEELKNR